MVSMLLQKHRDRLRPVAYSSCNLYLVTTGLPLCLQVVVATEKVVANSCDVVRYTPLTLLVLHAVHALLNEHNLSHLSTQRWLKYQTSLLEMPNVIVKHTALNPASLLPTEGESEPHDCVVLTDQLCMPRTDLSDEPLTNPVLYVDGSASRDSTGKNRVGGVATVHNCSSIQISIYK
ncbi:hypothetical protein SRHO_G00287030 [Serrasalmus rhombeus]